VYRIEISPAADRDISKLKGKISRRDFQRLRIAINNLALEPRPYGARKIKSQENSYRIRVGNFRVVYDVLDKETMILLLQVVRRNESTYLR
jgi:mRNA interferase RelE/StbE